VPEAVTGVALDSRAIAYRVERLAVAQVVEALLVRWKSVQDFREIVEGAEGDAHKGVSRHVQVRGPPREERLDAEDVALLPQRVQLLLAATEVHRDAHLAVHLEVDVALGLLVAPDDELLRREAPLLEDLRELLDELFGEVSSEEIAAIQQLAVHLDVHLLLQVAAKLIEILARHLVVVELLVLDVREVLLDLDVRVHVDAARLQVVVDDLHLLLEGLVTMLQLVQDLPDRTHRVAEESRGDEDHEDRVHLLVRGDRVDVAVANSTHRDHRPVQRCDIVGQEVSLFVQVLRLVNSEPSVLNPLTLLSFGEQEETAAHRMLDHEGNHD